MGSSGRSDAELLSLVAAHDALALRMFHDRHAPWVLARRRHRCSNDDMVFDALQDTFVAVWRTAGSWRGEGEPAAWVWGIASRRLIGAQRDRMSALDNDDTDLLSLPTPPRPRSGVGRYVLVAACLALVAIAAALVAVRRDPPAPAAPSLPAGFVDLGSVDDLGPGEVRWFEQHRLFLVRTGSEIMALSQQSPHRGCRLVTRAELDPSFFGPGAQFADPCHGSAFLLDGTRVGGPSSRGMYRYRVETAGGRIIADLRLVIPGSPVDPDLVVEPTPPPGVVDDVAHAWLAAANAAVEPVRDGNVGPMLWPLGAFHDADAGLVAVPLTVGAVFGVLQVGSFEVMEHWDYDSLDVIVPGERTAVGILNVYTTSADPAGVYVELTLPDDTGVKLRLDGFGGQWESAVDVVLEIVDAHTGGV